MFLYTRRPWTWSAHARGRSCLTASMNTRIDEYPRALLEVIAEPVTGRTTIRVAAERLRGYWCVRSPVQQPVQVCWVCAGSGPGPRGSKHSRACRWPFTAFCLACGHAAYGRPACGSAVSRRVATLRARRGWPALSMAVLRLVRRVASNGVVYRRVASSRVVYGCVVYGRVRTACASWTWCRVLHDRSRSSSPSQPVRDPPFTLKRYCAPNVIPSPIEYASASPLAPSELHR
jgi:hypothetical protein